MSTAIVLTGDPIVAPIAETALVHDGLEEMLSWIKTRRPECIPGDEVDRETTHDLLRLLPHEGKREPGIRTAYDGDLLTDAELLVEIAGRKCYDSWGAKAGQRTNAAYIANTQQGEIPHASIMYHPKMTFFIAGVSRRVSHELIRNYVGSDRDEEGSPSQESTRYTEHPGTYVAHPAILDDADELGHFADSMRDNYKAYSAYIQRRSAVHLFRTGEVPKGLARKRIFESASPYLSHACETSWIWTTNAIALAKLLKERGNVAADLEFQRLARRWAAVAVARWPNLFQAPHVRELADAHAQGLPLEVG